ncbi:unnamed protein product [Clonostachys byssicola]|uniref:Uncharacterized protein n=1 Tax=Clonostachys byssicola TaxID=160290 RepID=A0A9N9U3L4_9HYPO|nr:unnamed protein product [Clonostachys byssicola]
MADFQSGLWWDYSRPFGFQGTITLPVTQGNIFLSFLTFWVTVSGASLWVIFAYLLHSCIVRNRRNQVEIFDIQQRVTLINSKTPLATIIDSLRIYMAWSKHKIPGLLSRTLAIVLPTILFFVGITAASVFTSKVATSGDTGGLGLRRSQLCGLYRYLDPASDVLSYNSNESRLKVLMNQTVERKNYADNFYVNSTASPSRSPYVTPTLPHNESRVDCPFKTQARCILGFAMKLESALIDSHSMLGINAPPSDRVQFQSRTTCSVVNTTGLEEVSGNYHRYFLGGVRSNYTYEYNRGLRRDGIGYTLKGYGMQWEPLDELRVDNSEMSIFIISGNNVGYTRSISDPFFLATDYDNANKRFISTNDANFMICAEQYQFCNPVTHQCTPWSTSTFFRESMISQGLELKFNDAQMATALRLTVELYLSTSLIVDLLSTAALDASRKVMFDFEMSMGISTDRQWIIEASRWFQMRLAFLQVSVANYINVPAAVFDLPTTKLNDVSWLQGELGLSKGQVGSLNAQCHTQRERGYGNIQSFSFIGVLLIVIVGSGLIIISYNMTSIMDACGRLVKGFEAINAREGDDKQHLLRMALKASGYPTIGEWKTSYFRVPVISQQEIVEDLEVSGIELTYYPLKEAQARGPTNPHIQQHNAN